MKVLLFFLFVAGPFCVRAQRLDLRVPPALPGREGLPVPGWSIGGDSLLKGQVFVSRQGSRVVLLRPDGMACVVPNLRLVERMPVDRRGNADRMRRDFKP